MTPTHRWRCEGCGAEQIGPEDPGYRPYCPQCGVPLTKTVQPLKPDEKSAP